MSMNAELAQFYGTPGVDEAYEDQEKLASVEEFAKLAASHGIDLSAMDDESVDALYAEVYPEFAKTAQEDEEDEEDEEEEDKKKESAAYHFQEKLAFQEKFAEADFMGRVMAHAFTQELDSIDKTAGRGGPGVLSASERAVGDAGRPKGYGTRLGESVARSQKQRGMTSKGTPLGKTGRTTSGAKALEAAHGKKDYASLGRRLGSYARRAGRFMGKHPVGTAAAGLGLAGAAGAAGYAGRGSGKKKKASADFEELAANHAIKMASANGWDADEAFELVNSIYTLGLEETEKVAYVQDLDDAIHVRGLEYLESAGYPVDWEEVFG